MIYSSIVNEEPGSTDSVTTFRKRYNDLQNFYELIGKYTEFASGWEDVSGSYNDGSLYVLDESDKNKNQQVLKYRSMRSRATDLSRMQTVFLGGIIINHLVSALDAAFSARLHNKRLYQTDISWYDRINLDSYVTLYGIDMYTSITAKLSF